LKSRLSIDIRSKYSFRDSVIERINPMIEYLHAKMRHADFVEIGEAECNPDETVMVLVDAVEFVSDVAPRLDDEREKIAFYFCPGFSIHS